MRTVAPSGHDVFDVGYVFAGRYKVLAHIDRGSADLYHAWDQQLGHDCALKVQLTGDGSRSGSGKGGLSDEGIKARSVRHRGIVSIYDIGWHGDYSYIVMEWLGDRLLRRWIEENSVNADAPLDRVYNIIFQLLDPLEEAHAAGIVHRDLKPENIFVLDPTTSGSVRVKISDFGIATAQGETAERWGRFAGTPGYMAPELKTRAHTAGPTADIYSLSAIFYELLTGVPPVRESSAARSRPTLPAAVDSLIQDGLSETPKHRPQTVAEFRQRLQAALTHTARTAGKTTTDAPGIERSAPVSARAKAFVTAIKSLSESTSAQRWPKLVQPGVALAALLVAGAAWVFLSDPFGSRTPPASQDSTEIASATPDLAVGHHVNTTTASFDQPPSAVDVVVAPPERAQSDTALRAIEAATPSAAAERVTELIAGRTWESVVSQPSSRDRYSIRLNAQNGVVYVDYPELACGGSWELIDDSGKSARFRERLRQPTRCTNDGYVTVTVKDNDGMGFEYRRTANGSVIATASLRPTSRGDESQTHPAAGSGSSTGFDAKGASPDAGSADREPTATSTFVVPPGRSPEQETPPAPKSERELAMAQLDALLGKPQRVIVFPERGVVRNAGAIFLETGGDGVQARRLLTVGTGIEVLGYAADQQTFRVRHLTYGIGLISVSDVALQ